MTTMMFLKIRKGIVDVETYLKDVCFDEQFCFVFSYVSQ